MLSRDAEACYWIGRYVERAEATARMTDVHYHAALETFLPAALTEEGADESDDVMPLRWHSLLAICGGASQFQERYEAETDKDVLHFFTFDLQNPNSILSTWRAARENARAIREQIASEMWESLNVSFFRLREWNVDRLLAGSLHEFFEIVEQSSHLFQGIVNRTLMLGEARDWIDTGRFLERADQTARLLDVKYHELMPSLTEHSDTARVAGPLDTHAWIAVLKSVCAFEMYRKTHRDGIKPHHVVDFLVLNPQFPASVRHCIERVTSCLHRIGDGPPDKNADDPQRLVLRLCTELSQFHSEDILENSLHEFLDRVQHQCVALGDAVNRTYLVY